LIMQGDSGEVIVAEAVKDIMPLIFDGSYL
jgi:hypothetical protein